MSDRKVTLLVSRDGGHTWPIVREMSLGELGEYRHRVLFRRLGKSRRMVAKIRVTSPIRANLMGAFVDYDA